MVKRFSSPACFARAENGLYKLMRINEAEDMDWKKYALCAVVFNVFGFLALWAMQLLQNVLPLNPEGMPAASWHLGFNTASSFMTNTNWQSYSGEVTLSYFTQMLGLTVQNFVSAATGIAVLFALIRGLRRVKERGVGSFWTDMVRTVVYILIPLSLALALVQTSQGVIQNFSGHVEYKLVEPLEITLESGQTSEITGGYIPMGPASSQVAVKQLGTNGGGYNGLNSAHPLENPTPLSNLGEMLALLSNHPSRSASPLGWRFATRGRAAPSSWRCLYCSPWLSGAAPSRSTTARRSLRKAET